MRALCACGRPIPALLLAGLLLHAALPADSRAASPPPPRRVDELQAALARSPGTPPEEGLGEIRIVLLANEKDHGPDEHDYPLWQKRWLSLLAGKQGEESQVNLYGPAPPDPSGDALRGATRVKVSTSWEWPGRTELESADIIVAFTGTEGRWTPERLDDLERFLDRGGGFVAIHSAVITDRKLSRRLADLIGLAWESGTTTFRHGPVDLEVTAPDTPMLIGLPPRIHFVDESYWPLVGDRNRLDVLFTANERMPGEGGGVTPQPMVWTYRRGRGRVFGCILGHYTWTFDEPYFRMLILRGMAWAARETPFRFDPLILRGARVTDETSALEPRPSVRITPTPPDRDDPRLLLWLDSSDKKTITVDPDGCVSAWGNKSLKVGRSLASSGTRRPRYVAKGLAGLPAIRFDGKDDLLRDTGFNRSVERWTLFVVTTVRSNAGGFRAFFAANRSGVNDYVSGINLDMGGGPSGAFDTLNLEGIRHPGQCNLRVWSAPFGSYTIIISSGEGGAQAFVNGVKEGVRGAGGEVASLEEIRVGARIYENPVGKMPLVERGFLDGDLSEVIFYDEDLRPAAREPIHAYLEKKYGRGLTRPEVPTLEGAFEKLPAYRIGESRMALAPIDDAIVASHGDGAARRILEERLAAVLRSGATRDAKAFVCRRLAMIGSGSRVPALAPLLSDAELSHMARYALERVSSPEAAEALRKALPKVSGPPRIGVIDSIGRMADRSAVGLLIPLLDDPNPDVAAAAATALARIGAPDSIVPLDRLRARAKGNLAHAAKNACLELAYRLLDQGNKGDAAGILRRLETDGSGPVRIAAFQGLVAALPEEAEDRLFRALTGGEVRLRAVARLILGGLDPELRKRLEERIPRADRREPGGR